MAALLMSDRVAVIGAGAMGRGIAAVAAQAGHEVYLFDMNADAAHAAPALIGGEWQGLVKRGKWTQDALDAAVARIHPVTQLTELADAALVVEAIVEQAEPKQALFRELETLLSERAILASNTSSISMTLLARGLSRPERFAGLHFFNPATRMKLVEVIHGLATDPAVIDTLVETVQAWDKLPVRAQSTPGFIVNRVARPYYAEGLRILNERAATPETIDAVLREAVGFPMGPFELMDLIGHDVNYAVTSSVFAAMYQDDRFQPSLIQLERVAAGWLGRKTGRGFYDYREGSQRPAPHTEPAYARPVRVKVVGELGALEALVTRLAAAGVIIDREPSATTAYFELAGGLRLALSDGRTATARAAETGHADWALLDVALDYATAPRVAITVADQAAEGSADLVAGLLQAAGIAVSRIDDIAGLVVLRTLSMLANEAADTVLQGIANAHDVDMAMRYGTNYPIGPLAWADRFGVEQVCAALDALYRHYGESRYRVSPLIRRLSTTGGTFHD